MDAEKWKQVKDVFNQAIELDDEPRAHLIASLESDTVRNRVEKLLVADKAANSYDDAPIISNFLAKSLQGQIISNYKILKEIGRGGMGAVFLAERIDIEKRVALKIIKHEFSSTELLRRFQNERKILARLEHPFIARLLDGGATEEGLPYFVMEYIEGEDLLSFCRNRNLSVNAKLDIFRKVCAAVAYAHSLLVVHRDLKPSNILINKDGEPKLLDFGISKLLADGEQEPYAQPGTATQLGMMTPNYASPEQFRGETVSTTSDVYSLGVILYQLLTDRLPYDVSNHGLDEVVRIVCETVPPKPSEMSTFFQTAPAASGSEKNDESGHSSSHKSKFTAQHSRLLRGDLDNIILKALRKEPERRYMTVEQFSEDLRRHQTGLPVTARPDTFSYRAEKFIKRNRTSVMAAGLLLFTLVGGISATSWQAYRAEQQKGIADQRFSQVRALANNIVFKYYDEAEKLENSTPIREMFVKDSLDYLDSLAQDKSTDEALRAELAKAFLRIGRVQGRPFSPNLGDTDGALENYRKGLEILEPLAFDSPDSNVRSDLLTAYGDYAVILRQKGNNAESDKIFRKAIEAGEAFLRQNPENADIISRLALIYMFQGDSLPIGAGENENINSYRKALSAFDVLLKANPSDLRINNYYVATNERIGFAIMALAKSARFDENADLEKQYLLETKPRLETNIRISEDMFRLHPKQILPPALLASAQISYASLLIETEDYPHALENLRKAERFYRQSLENDETSVGQKVEVSTVEQKLAVINSRTGDSAKADALYDHAIELLNYLVSKDAENFDYIKFRGEAKFNYADELLRRGEIEKARKIYESAYNEMLPAAEKKDSAYAASLRAHLYEKLGDCSLARKTKNRIRIEQALNEYQKAIEVWRTNKMLNLNGIEQNDKLNLLQRKIDRLRDSISS